MKHKSIQKLKSLVDKYLNLSTQDILLEWSNPRKCSSENIWIYKRWSNLIFYDEISFILENNIVVDIALTEYTLWIAKKNIFYFEGQMPEYKIIKL